MNTGSALFMELREEELRACVLHYLGQPLLSWELLRGGLFNTTYRLDLPDKSVILRLGPVNRHLLLPYEQGLMGCEPVIQQLLRSRGIPTSKTLAIDLERKLLDRDIAIVELIPGINMTATVLDEDTQYSVCRRAGELTRVIHGITARDLPSPPEKLFGRASAVLAGKGSSSWKKAMLSELQQWRDCARTAQTFSDAEIRRFCTCFEYFSWAFDAVTEPCLVHGDLWYGNILIDAEGSLVAIIDADRAYFGDPEFDLMLPWMPRVPFMEGYGDTGSAADPVLRRELYRMLLCLEDCYILQMEYRNTQSFLEAKEDALRRLSVLENRI